MQNNNRVDQKRIVKNTVMLYIRMAVIMLVSLYTSRVVLDVLGVDDYGIYNIVGGVVVSLAFVANALTSSIQRFMSYELGLEEGTPARVYSMSLNIIILLVIVSVVILETLGLWFLNNVLDIPPSRLEAANIAYQCSVFTFCVNLIRIPYNAMIISFEKMSIYALISIVEAVLKLAIVFLLVLFPDKLISYALLMFIVSTLITVAYWIGCRWSFRETCVYHFERDKGLFNKILGFSGWTLLGGFSGMTASEGPNYLMNIYLGVRVNAAMGLAKQVSAAIYSFTSNFQVAFNPQIVKLYASGVKDELNSFINKTSLLSFYLMIVFAIPLIFFAPLVFDLWLVEVPEYAIEFSILMMISQMIAALGSPLWMLAHATGDIKVYQIVISGMNILILPISWAILYVGLSPYLILFSNIILSVGIFIFRILFLKKTINFPLRTYFSQVVIKSIVIGGICMIIPAVLAFLSNTVWLKIASLILSVVYCCCIIFFCGLSSEEKQMILNKVKSILG